MARQRVQAWGGGRTFEIDGGAAVQPGASLLVVPSVHAEDMRGDVTIRRSFGGWRMRKHRQEPWRRRSRDEIGSTGRLAFECFVDQRRSHGDG
jgi:hypothetical protein